MTSEWSKVKKWWLPDYRFVKEEPLASLLLSEYQNRQSVVMILHNTNITQGTERQDTNQDAQKTYCNNKHTTCDEFTKYVGTWEGLVGAVVHVTQLWGSGSGQVDTISQSSAWTLNSDTDEQMNAAQTLQNVWLWCRSSPNDCVELLLGRLAHTHLHTLLHDTQARHYKI